MRKREREREKERERERAMELSNNAACVRVLHLNTSVHTKYTATNLPCPSHTRTRVARTSTTHAPHTPFSHTHQGG